MGQPVEQPSAVSLLEDAAHLLRQAPLDTLMCHWIGSAPFALGVLLFWNDQSHHTSDIRCAADSLILALLLIWMNCWRAVYAGKMHRLLSGALDTPWNAARVRALIGNQAFLAGLKLMLLPLSLAAIFPFATTVAFFRNGAVFADRPELDPMSLIGKARRLARLDRFQCWMVQALLLPLAFGAWLNVLVSCAILPELIKMLTGYESVFTRSGRSYVENPLFILVTLGLTWLFFDPFVQAVYCLRCFLGDSVETGEDLRAALRRVRAEQGSLPVATPGPGPKREREGAASTRRVIATVLLASFLATFPASLARAADAVSTGELEHAVRKALDSPEYNWRFPPPDKAQSDTSWIIRATDRALRAIGHAIQWLWNEFQRLLKWIFGGINFSPLSAGGAASATAVHVGLWLLAVAAAVVAGIVIWRALARKRKRTKKPAATSTTVIRLEDEGLTADRLPEEGWLEMAERSMAEGNLRLALRAFYLANLAWLSRQEFIRIHPGKTNREFEVELRRRTRTFPEARELFSENVRSFERAWYGLHDVSIDDALEFRRRSDEIKRILGAAVLDKQAGAAA